MSLLQICVLNPLSKLIDVVTGANVTVLTEGDITETTADIYTVLVTDGTILANGGMLSGAQDILLPIGPTVPLKKVFTIKNISTGAVVLECTDFTTSIDFASYTGLTTKGDSISVQWDGTQYWILSNYLAP
jgi:hypothetical protein